MPVGKLHNDRYLPLHPVLVNLLDDWRADHRDDAMLITRHGRLITRDVVGRIVRCVARLGASSVASPDTVCAIPWRSMSIEAIAGRRQRHPGNGAHPADRSGRGRDIGLLPAAGDAAEGLYRLVAAAYERRSVAMSTNLHPSGFDEIMPKTLAGATVESPPTHAHLCATTGDGGVWHKPLPASG